MGKPKVKPKSDLTVKMKGVTYNLEVTPFPWISISKPMEGILIFRTKKVVNWF